MSYLSNMIYGNGCKRKVEIPKSSRDLEELCEFISTDYLTRDIYVDAMNKKRALKVGREFLDKYFTLHNLWQVDHDAIKRRIGNGTITISDLLAAEKECERYIHPFSLKVVYSNKYDIFQGELKARTYTKELGDITRAQPSFIKIDLCSKATIVTPPVYVHELTHSQLQSNLGSVRYYKNIELLPYFLELVCAHDMGEHDYILKILEKFLSNEIVKYRNEITNHENGTYRMTRDQLVETGKYLSSTISALNLFIMYYNGSPSTKKYILQEIQKIFDGLQDLEEFTKKICITDKIDNKVLQKHLVR